MAIRNQQKTERNRLYSQDLLVALNTGEKYIKMGEAIPRNLIERTAYLSVMEASTRERVENYDNTTNSDIEMYFDDLIITLQFIGVLTPIEFERVFPIKKTYDGERWETKDYFYTKKILNGFPQDEPIIRHTEMFEMLWDYQNLDLSMLLIECMHYRDLIRQLEGEPTAFESFVEENNIPAYSRIVGKDGKKFLINNQIGKPMKVSNPLPRHLKVIK